MIAFYLADHAHLWARFAGFSTSGKVLVGFFALVAAAAVYLAWEFHVAPLIPNPGDTQAIQDADDEACALTRPAPAVGRAAVVPELPADQWARIERQMQAAYDDYRAGGGLPGETRTTWTREDYRS